MLEACAFNWTNISPAIFGALFQSVMSPKQRRAQGAHYTTEKNILKVIEPLFLDDLRAEPTRRPLSGVNLPNHYTQYTTMATTITLDFAKPHVLRNAREYKAAVAEIDRLLDEGPARGSDAYNNLEFLSVLVEAYEDDHYGVDEAERGGTPQSVVMFMLEQREMTRSDLAPLMGGKARVSEFLAGKRRLSVEQIRSLRDALGIPADLLIA